MGYQGEHSMESGKDSAAGPLNVVAVLARVVAELQDVAGRAAFGASGDEVLAGLVASVKVVSGAQSAYLNAIRALAAHPEVVGAGLSGRQAVLSVLTTGLRVSGGQAARDYAAAMATAGTGRAPRLGRAPIGGGGHWGDGGGAGAAGGKRPQAW